MSIKSKVFAAAATLTLVGGVGAAGAISASAATPSCGFTCIEVFNHNFGTHKHPNFILDTLRRARRSASRRSCSASATPTRPRTTPSPTRAWCRLLPGRPGVRGGQPALRCRRRRVPGRLRLRDPVRALRRGQRPVRRRRHHRGRRREGRPGAVWRLLQDRLDRRLRGLDLPGYVPLINGSDTNFSQPFVLTYPGAVTRPTSRGRSCSSPTSPVSPTGLATTRPV